MLTTGDLFDKFHSPRGPLHQARQRLAGVPHELERLFASCFPAGLLAQADEGPNSRERIYSRRVTFWTFLWQVLNPDSSCRNAVRKVMAWFALLGGPKVPEDDSPYCQARRRLDQDTLERALRASAQAAEQKTRAHWPFHGKDVVVGDGTTSTLPDTQANQRAYPQSTRQNPGCGFPLLRWVALFSLQTGALLAVATGNKHKAELKLFRQLWDQLKAGTLFLADRGFCDFVTMIGLWRRQVDSLLRLNASRPHDLRQGRRLGRYDRLVTWQKPQHKPRTATRKLWRSLPDQVTLRLLSYPVLIAGFRPQRIFLVTTLLDPVAFPAAELAELYWRRWRVELFLRDIKTTLQMESLRCKSPAMVYRELLMHLIAYNLIRCLMAEAASIYEVSLERISFKGSMDTVRHFSQVMAQARSRRQQTELLNAMLSALAGDPLPDRPHRIEPRHQKRRPKAYPFLIKPRGQRTAQLLRRKNHKNQRS
jgi:Transposase DDE domain